MYPSFNLTKAKRASRRLTDYRKRYALLKSDLPRLVIRFTNRQIIMQLVTYEPQGDRINHTWLSSKLCTRSKSEQTLFKMYAQVHARIVDLYGANYRFIIDSGLKNNSLKLKKLYEYLKN